MRLSWREAIVAMMLSPLLLGCLVLLLPLLLLKVPSIFCSHFRAFRYVVYAGSAYYGVMLTLATVLLKPSTGEIIFWSLCYFAAGEWLVPDVLTFAVHKRKRRAAARAITYVETHERRSVNYGRTRVIAVESDRVIVELDLIASMIPSPSRFVAVYDQPATIEFLQWQEVATHYGLHPRF